MFNKNSEQSVFKLTNLNTLTSGVIFFALYFIIKIALI